MRRLSNRLLVWTALLFAMLLIISQVTWIAVGSLFFLKPLRVGYVAQLATQVNLARAALASMPRDARSAFLEQVNRQFNIRLVPIRPPYGEVMAPDREFPRHMQMILRRMAGDDAKIGEAHDAKIEFEGVPILYLPWVSFPLSDERKSGISYPSSCSVPTAMSARIASATPIRSRWA